MNTSESLSSLSAQTFITTILTLLFGIIYYVRKVKNQPPGPLGLPYVGYWPFLKDDTAHLQLRKLGRKYGSVFSFTVMGQLFIHLGTIKMVKEAHVMKADCFGSRFSGFSILSFIFNEGLTCLNGEAWKVQRKFFIKAFRDFGMTSMKDYITRNIYDSMLSTVESLKAEGGKPVNIISIVTPRCSTILHRMVFNDEGITEEELKKLVEAYEKVLDLFTNTNGFLVGKFARRFVLPLTATYKPAVLNHKVMVDVLQKIIRKHEATFNKNNIRDMIDSFINERNEKQTRADPSSKYFTEESLISSLIQIVGDGVISVAIFISCYIDALLEHPEEQEKILKELDEVIGPDGQPTLEDKNKLPYTNAFILEVTRTNSFFSLFPDLHECTKETTLNGHKIPKGSITVVNFWACHRDPNTFENPDDFKPSRYLEESGKEKPELSVLFGVGKRSCIGESFVMMEVFLFVTTIVKNFRLTRPESCNKKSLLNGSMEVCAWPRR